MANFTYVIFLCLVIYVGIMYTATCLEGYTTNSSIQKLWLDSNFLKEHFVSLEIEWSKR